MKLIVTKNVVSQLLRKNSIFETLLNSKLTEMIRESGDKEISKMTMTMKNHVLKIPK